MRVPLIHAWRVVLAALVFATAPAMADDDQRQEQARQTLELLENSHWVAEGAEDPERVAYTFTDMECPFCARQWDAMRPFIDDPDNVVQVRHILVGVLKPQSHAKGAAVLAADDPLAALERGQETFNEGGIEPLQDIPEAVNQALNENVNLMRQLGIGGTPATIFTDPNGRLQFAPGMMDQSTLKQYLFQL